MIVDANILLYSRNISDPNHEQARQWLTSALDGDTRVGLPWSSLGAFMRIATNPRVFPVTLTPTEVADQVEEWLGAPRAWIPQPSERYGQVVTDLVRSHKIRGPLIADAMLVALAIDHGVVLVSNDEGLARFTEVTLLNPLA